VGIARSLADVCTLCCPTDLAVRQLHQRDGIGKKRIRGPKALGPNARIVNSPALLVPSTFPTLELLRSIPQYATLAD